MGRIRLRGNTIRPLLLHDEDLPSNGPVWSYRNVLYNKSLMTNAATLLVCCFFLTGIWITTKKAPEFAIGKHT